LLSVRTHVVGIGQPQEDGRWRGHCSHPGPTDVRVREEPHPDVAISSPQAGHKPCEVPIRDVEEHQFMWRLFGPAQREEFCPGANGLRRDVRIAQGQHSQPPERGKGFPRRGILWFKPEMPLRVEPSACRSVRKRGRD
jgi:hypothetical protein